MKKVALMVFFWVSCWGRCNSPFEFCNGENLKISLSKLSSLRNDTIV